MTHSKIEPVTGLFAVYDPTTEYIVHTTVSATPEDSIEMWMEIECGVNTVANEFRKLNGKPQQCFRPWEQFEAEGYKVICVTLTADSPDAVATEV